MFTMVELVAVVFAKACGRGVLKMCRAEVTDVREMMHRGGRSSTSLTVFGGECGERFF